MNTDFNVKTPAYSERVFEYIRSKILDGHYRPGQRLSEVELSQMMGVSRSPIREALLRLGNEGLVKSVTHKGTTVATFDEREIRELFELREAIEGMAARLAALQASDEQLADIDQLLVATSQILSESSSPGYPWDIDYHHRISQIAGNRKLEAKWSEVSSQIRLARSLSGASSPRALTAYSEHVEIALALTNRDEAAAEMLMRQHIRNSLESTLSLVESTKAISR